MVHPMSKKPVVRGSTAVDYAADVMVILAYHKFLDDWHDERSAAGFAGKLAFGRAYRKLRKQYPNVCMHVEAALSKLSALEAEQSGSIDRTSEAFSDLMESLFTGFAEKYRDAVSPVQERVLSQLGRALGRWIYMIDALDDFAKDEKCGSYNPLLYRKNYLAGMEILLYHSLAEIEKAYDLLDFAKNREIIENIIFLGLRLQTDRVLAERIHVDAQSI